MQHMQSIIPWLFDSWADPVVHLLLLKSSMTSQNIANTLPQLFRCRTCLGGHGMPERLWPEQRLLLRSGENIFVAFHH